MGSEIFVGNLTTDVNERDLRTMFEAFGAVTSVRLIPHPRDPQGPRHGFVIMARAEVARVAVEALNGAMLHGQALRVGFARAEPRTGPRGSAGGSPSRPGGRRPARKEPVPIKRKGPRGRSSR